MSDNERDVWLREALRHAPDADAAPPRDVSETILAQARAAARRGATPAPSAGTHNPIAALWDWLARPPVAAGFASVMAATIVGLMWWDRPMDEALPPRPQPALPAQPAPPDVRAAETAAAPAAPEAGDHRAGTAKTDALEERAPRATAPAAPAAPATPQARSGCRGCGRARRALFERVGLRRAGAEIGRAHV